MVNGKIHLNLLSTTHKSLIKTMSNYKTKAKKPNGKEFEEVSMLDNFFGQHNYGVEFPDGAIYKPEKCEFEEEITKDPKQQQLQEFEEKFGYLENAFIPKGGSSYDNYSLIDVEPIKQFLSEAISQTEKETRENLISAFKEMVEEQTYYHNDDGVKELENNVDYIKVADLLSSLTEEIKHGAGSNCDIDMCPECAKSDNSFSN
jgi:hypothetical protein